MWANLFFISETMETDAIKRSPALHSRTWKTLVIDVECNESVLLVIESDSQPDMKRATEIEWYQLPTGKGKITYRRTWATGTFIRTAVHASQDAHLTVKIRGSRRACFGSVPDAAGQ